MGQYFSLIGDDYLLEQENFMKLLRNILDNGKPVIGYYGNPYINHHYGPLQTIIRTGRREDGGLEVTGFDTHYDSPNSCCWKMRIIEKLDNKDEDDPLYVRLFLKGMDGKNMLMVEVMNGDILPSFKKDEVVELQMIAFPERVSYYADEDEYSKTVEPGLNGKIITIGHNTVFPVGLFSENEDAKDIVQIHGQIKKIAFDNKRSEKFMKRKTSFRCQVETQMGDIVIVCPMEGFEEYDNNPNMREGKIIDCFAHLSGDAAIFAYEDGLIRDAEHNLKLLVYSLEEGDPERLRSVMSDHFVYESDNTGRRFDSKDEFIELSKQVHQNKNKCHVEYATIEEITDGPEELKYPVGTRCAVIRYDDEEGYNALIFVDNDDEGNIERIYFSKEARYRFRIDPPLEEPEDIFAEIAKQTYQVAMTNRAHFHNIVGSSLTPEEVEKYLLDHEQVLSVEIDPLVHELISEDIFSKAFMVGIRRSGKRYKESDMKEIGGQFCKDFTLRISEEDQSGKIRHALLFTASLGSLFIGNGESEAAPAEGEIPVIREDKLEDRLTLEHQYGEITLKILDENRRADGYREMEQLELRYPEAGVVLGQYYQGKDAERAKAHFRVAVDAGIVEGQWGYANMIPHSYAPNMSDPDDREFVKYCLSAAEGGCADAANEMGNICHRNGFFGESTYWYGMARALEHPAGMVSLKGIIKKWSDHGGPKEFRAFTDTFTEQRYATSLLLYSMFTRFFDTADMDDLMKLALKGENLAGFVMAEIMEQNHHDDMAYKVFNALSFGDHPHALRCYADMLAAGKGCEQDMLEAFIYYKKAADAGNAAAMFVMGEQARKEGDRLLAACWYGKAYDRGFEMAGDRLSQLV